MVNSSLDDTRPLSLMEKYVKDNKLGEVLGYLLHKKWRVTTLFFYTNLLNDFQCIVQYSIRTYTYIQIK